MVAIGMVLVWGAYTLAYWGVQLWTGCPASLLDVAWPGKFTPCTPGAATPTPPAANPTGTPQAKAKPSQRQPYSHPGIGATG